MIKTYFFQLFSLSETNHRKQANVETDSILQQEVFDQVFGGKKDGELVDVVDEVVGDKKDGEEVHDVPLAPKQRKNEEEDSSDGMWVTFEVIMGVLSTMTREQQDQIKAKIEFLQKK